MVPPSPQNRHCAYRHPVYTTKRAHEQDGLLVVATPAYQTAYQSVRLGAIKQVLRRTLATLGAAVKRGRILADTEEVTGSNPVSPTKKALVSYPFCDLARACGGWIVDPVGQTIGLSLGVAIEKLVDGARPTCDDWA
jgi:hypothetical protein